MHKHYKLSKIAKKTIHQIDFFTEATWGKNQREQYIKSLFERFEFLAQHPSAGHDRSNILPKLQSYPYGSHMIYYVAKPYGISVVDILHQKMDPKSHF